MNKSKGFTLIELLAVIVVLAVILAIAIPTISRIIDNSKAQAFVKDEGVLVKAAKDYFLTFRNGLPANIGDTTEVQITELKANDFINHIMSPYDTNKECTGYVLVTKIYANQYSYVPHLNCVASIDSSATDKLIGHWTFDDFEEPTQNMITNPLNFNWSEWGHTSIGWAVTEEQMPSDYDNDGLMSKFTIQAGPSTGNSYAQIFKSSYSITKDATYGISFYAKAKVGRRIEVGIIQADSPWANYVPATKTISVTNEWKRYEIALNATNTATDARIQLNTGLDKWNDELYIYKPQFEARNPTPFTATTRSALVKDYSINNSQATLQLSTSPRWVRNGMVGSGAYQFDGNSRYILTDSDINISGSQTFTAWVNPSIIDGNLRGIVSLHNHSTTSNLGLNTVFNGKLSVSIGYTDGTREFNTKTSTKILSINKWSFVSMVYDSDQNKVSLYIDGILDSSFSITKPIKFSPGKLLIGEWSSSYLTNYNFNGYIDDVRLYNRVLSNDELLQLYNAHNY